MFEKVTMDLSGSYPYRKISSIFIETDSTRKFFNRMGHLMQRGREEGYCKSLLLIGPSGSGKSQMLLEWQRLALTRHPGKRVVISEVPVGCKQRGMEEALLHDLGDPDPEYGGPAARLARIQTLGRTCDVIMLDETQRLVDENTGKVKKDVASWITNLLNKNLCPIVLVGENDSTLVFEGVTYAERRSLGQVTVAPYTWADEQDQFRAFLATLEKHLGMPGKSGLGHMDIALRIHSFSRGRVGLVAQLVDEARAVAHDNGRQAITQNDLAEAVDLLRIGKSRNLPNPFRIAKPASGDKPLSHVRDEDLKVEVEGKGSRRKPSAT